MKCWMKPKAKRRDQPYDPNRPQMLGRDGFARDSAAVFFIFLKMLNCRMARSSKFRFSHSKNPEGNLLQDIAAIERVALGGNEASIGDDVAEFGLVGAGVHASGDDQVFF